MPLQPCRRNCCQSLPKGMNLHIIRLFEWVLLASIHQTKQTLDVVLNLSDSYSY